jgi:hypothetical protein
MKRSLMFLLMVVVVAVGGIAKGQQPKKMARIGYLSWLSRTSSTSLAFKEGLRELGWPRENRSRLSIATGTTFISFLSLRLNLFALKLTSSSLRVVTCLRLQRSVRRQQSRL